MNYFIERTLETIDQHKRKLDEYAEQTAQEVEKLTNDRHERVGYRLQQLNDYAVPSLFRWDTDAFGNLLFVLERHSLTVAQLQILAQYLVAMQLHEAEREHDVTL